MAEKSFDNAERLPVNTIFFRLDEHLQVKPVPTDDFLSLASSLADYNWTYQTKLLENIVVSSTFLGVKLPSFSGSQPLVFETMVFNAKGESCWSSRYSGIDDCIEGHNMVVDEIERAGKGAWESSRQ